MGKVSAPAAPARLRTLAAVVVVMVEVANVVVSLRHAAGTPVAYLKHARRASTHGAAALRVSLVGALPSHVVTASYNMDVKVWHAFVGRLQLPQLRRPLLLRTLYKRLATEPGCDRGRSG
jgi:hypothetical protein